MWMLLLSAAVGDCLIPTEQGTALSFIGQNWCKGKAKAKPVSSSLSIERRSTAFASSHHHIQREQVMYYLHLGGE